MTRTHGRCCLARCLAAVMFGSDAGPDAPCAVQYGGDMLVSLSATRGAFQTSGGSGLTYLVSAPLALPPPRRVWL